MLKVLYYNWTDCQSSRGGGVTVYLRNLINALRGNRKICPVFISAGDVYSPFSFKPYIRPLKSRVNSDCPAFELVNSPVPAPGTLLVHNLHNYLDQSDCTVLELLRKFIIEQGGFDVIHFHNLEGLPLNVLKIKEYFPGLKIIFSLHNYFPFCPQVQLFQNHNQCRCKSFRGGLECGRCRRKPLDPQWFIEAMTLWFEPGSIRPQLLKPWLKFKSAHLAEKLLSIKAQRNLPQTYKEFRRLNIAFINRYVDKILAVSQRVADLATGYGIRPDLLEVAYIGTDYAGIKPFAPAFKPEDSSCFTLAFLGYARAAKGFFFLLSALEQLPDEMSAQINLRFAARYIYDAVPPQRLQKLRQRFHRLEISDGYRRGELPKLLTDVDLGVVPVIWEDNLPQVAIEMAACGVAVLASDFGGASELSSSPYFRFRGNDTADFIAHLSYIFNHRDVLAEYHRMRRPLTTMSRHISQLAESYRPDVRTLSQTG